MGVPCGHTIIVITAIMGNLYPVNNTYYTLNNYPDTHHFQVGMKFARQILPLPNEIKPGRM